MLRTGSVIAIGAFGTAAVGATWPFVAWELAVLVGWDLAATLFLARAWRTILRADASTARVLAMAEDGARRKVAATIVVSSMASLIAVALNLATADSRTGWPRGAHVMAALVTVMLSWTVLNTLYTLRYADAHHRAADGFGIEFGAAGAGDDQRPDYRDFAYLAFTVGMCYQVSDQAIRRRQTRRTVLVHALISYVFGVVIIASTINVFAGLTS